MRKRLLAVSACVLVTLAVFSPVCHSADEGEEAKGTPAGWSDNINLSNDPGERDNLPEIAVNGDNIHVVWLHRYRDVFYSKSTDCGKNWSVPQILYTWATIDYPYIGVSGDNVHVAWSGREVAGTNRVMYCNSTDNGETWNPPKEIFNSTGIESYCWGIYVNNSNIHITSEDMRDGANGEIYYRRSLDGGITFDNGQGVDEDRRITFGLTVKTRMTIGGDGSNISIAWMDERNGNWEIYWMISKDNGFTWEDGLGNINQDKRLTTTGADNPAIAVNNSKIHLVYVDPASVVEYRVYYRNSTDNGATWNPRILLTGPSVGIVEVDIDIEGDNVYVVWDDERDDGSHEEVYYTNSTDGGVTWSGDLRLTYNLSTYSFHPKIAINNNATHIVWYDRFPSNDREIYYKRYPDFPPDPEYNVTLNEGWNLISLPLEQRDEAINEVLSSIDGKWDIIQTYDPLSPEPWKTNNTYKPNSLNDFDTLNHKVGFWINITEPGGVNLTVQGPIPTSTSIPLYAGWNLVGYPSLTNETVANALFGTTADRVEVFDPAEPYRIKEVGPSYIMKPGEGYWIHVVADSVWVVDW